MMLGIVAFVGEHGPDPGHDGEGGQEQPLEHQSVVDVGRGGPQATGTPSPSSAMWYLVPRLPRSVGIGPGQIAAALGPHRARIEDQVGIAAQHADQDGMNLRQQARPRPPLQMAAQGRAADLSAVAVRLRHGVPSRRNRRIGPFWQAKTCSIGARTFGLARRWPGDVLRHRPAPRLLAVDVADRIRWPSGTPRSPC